MLSFYLQFVVNENRHEVSVYNLFIYSLCPIFVSVIQDWRLLFNRDFYLSTLFDLIVKFGSINVLEAPFNEAPIHKLSNRAPEIQSFYVEIQNWKKLFENEVKNVIWWHSYVRNLMIFLQQVSFVFLFNVWIWNRTYTIQYDSYF